ncbi:SCP2 sterol-binding domain-containing protein [Alicyclobacillus sp. SO9]|uniref:SCP2 sterol-binding domain-containing protein n=1 Tax=Alicyclobacillus sp. SO9 TaxID=2665646 RepID=UPI0018E8351A|nr:SCP2 sterol-binding domain-containing protein [Alicyclobacillus sp. SO9]QQE78174.1 SCP2 sterol-binding domain-containing protein [Alicyclobacillus sp. SO9]
MGLFQSEQDVYDVLGAFFRDAAKDEAMGPAIQTSGLVIQFEYSDPNSVLTIDTTKAEAGTYFAVMEGPVDVKPDVHMTMKADVANQFWLGKLNLLAALSRRQMVAKGPIPKILKLLPAIQPAYAKYQAYVEDIGRPELLKK